MLGQGTADSANLVMKSGELGIPGDFEDFAAPKTLVPYSRGIMYYHEGLSLQECVLPCLSVQLEAADKKARKSSPPRLTLTYRQGKTDRITSRRPVVDLTWPQGDFFSEEGEMEVVVEVIDAKENIVGSVSCWPVGESGDRRCADQARCGPRGRSQNGRRVLGRLSPFEY